MLVSCFMIFFVWGFDIWVKVFCFFVCFLNGYFFEGFFKIVEKFVSVVIIYFCQCFYLYKNEFVIVIIILYVVDCICLVFFVLEFGFGS